MSPTPTEGRAKDLIVEQFLSSSPNLVLIAWGVVFETLGALMMYLVIRTTVAESTAQDVTDHGAPRD